MISTHAARIAASMSLISLLTGCLSRIDLPEITADKFRAVHNNPWGSIEIEADRLVNHADKVTADRVVYHRNGRVSSGHVEIAGYVRQKEPSSKVSTLP